MREYDPEHPEWFTYYRQIEVPVNVRAQFVSDPRYTDVYLVLNGRGIGRMMNIFGRVICQSSMQAGMFVVYDIASKYYLGHIFIHDSTAHAYIRANEALAIDPTVLYKMENRSSVEPERCPETRSES